MTHRIIFNCYIYAKPASHLSNKMNITHKKEEDHTSAPCISLVASSRMSRENSECGDRKTDSQILSLKSSSDFEVLSQRSSQRSPQRTSPQSPSKKAIVIVVDKIPLPRPPRFMQYYRIRTVDKRRIQCMYRSMFYMFSDDKMSIQRYQGTAYSHQLENAPILYSTSILRGIHQLCSYARSLYKSFDDVYVVAPTYWSHAHENFTDSQITVTGSAYKKTSTRNISKKYVAMKEMCEEVGVMPKTQDHLHDIVTITESKTILNFAVRALDCVGYSGDSNLFERTNGLTKKDEDKSTKVQVMIFGTLSEIHEMMNQIIFRHPSDDLKDNLGLRVIPLDHVMRWLSTS